MNLITYTKIKVRFSEVDSIKMVWHGHYLKYLEDAREQWGNEFGLSYQTIYDSGHLAPIYDLKLNYLSQATLNDVLEVEIKYVPSKGAKLRFEYIIRRLKNKQIILKASSIQLFTDLLGNLQPSIPTFFEDWQSKSNSYFSVIQQDKIDNEFVFDIQINPSCSVFKGHFPQEAICPGACNIQMVLDICESVLNCNLLLTLLKKVKFTKLMHPDIKMLQLSLKIAEIDDSNFDVRAVLKDKVDKYMSLSSLVTKRL